MALHLDVRDREQTLFRVDLYWEAAIWEIQGQAETLDLSFWDDSTIGDIIRSDKELHIVEVY